MLTFYPEFESEEIDNPEVVFLVDCSNSMKGDAIQHARKVCNVKNSMKVSQKVNNAFECYNKEEKKD